MEDHFGNSAPELSSFAPRISGNVSTVNALARLFGEEAALLAEEPHRRHLNDTSREILRATEALQDDSSATRCAS
jgi:hypothetical protein